MRTPVAIAVLAIAVSPARAESLPAGSLGMVVGAASGMSADASRLGFGYQIGAQAAWQPMKTESPFGLGLRWSFVFGTMYDAEAASVGDELLTFQMDLMGGVRVRPWSDPSRYLTLRAGVQLMRANQIVLPSMERAFIGDVFSVGFDQYAYRTFLMSIDVRVSQLVANNPTTIALMFGIGKTGP